MFQQKYLKIEQLQNLYGQAFEQAEAQVANAWLNLVMNQDNAHQALYDMAKDKLNKLEKDAKRMFSPQ